MHLDGFFSFTDVTPPVFVNGCPNILRYADAFGTETHVLYDLPYVEDNSGENLTVVGSPASGSVFNVSDTQVTVTAVDNSGNTAHCTFNVSVIGEYNLL